MKHNAFSLIELLVVISIIAILVGILMPAMASAREVARSVKCLSNTRAIAMVMDLYASDDPNNFYPTARMPMTAPFETSWTYLTRPYIEAAAAYNCPTDPIENWNDPVMPRFTSYGINAYFTPNHPPYMGIRPDQVIKPSRTIIAAELVEIVRSDHFMPMYWGAPSTVMNMMMQNKQWDLMSALPKTVAIERHRQTANYVFTDAHAANHLFADTWQQTTGFQPSVNWYEPFED